MSLNIVFLLVALFVSPTVAASEPASQAQAQYELQLSRVLERMVQLGTAGIAEVDVQWAGLALIDAAHAEVERELLAEADPGATQRITHALKAVTRKLNAVAAGRWLIETAYRHGPIFAVLFGVSELSEQIGIVLAIKNPEFVFLLPFFLSHASDALAVGLSFTAPKAIRMAALWQRFGGLRQGPDQYYRALLSQRAALPVDWSVAVDVADFGLGQFAVIEEGRLERTLPRWIRLRVTPRKLAQRESLPTFAIWELEAVLDRHGLDAGPLKSLRNKPLVHANALLRTIAKNRAASTDLNELFTGKEAEVSMPARAPQPPLDARALANSASVDSFKRARETPDLLAQRLYWYFDYQLSKASDRAPGLPWRQRLILLGLIRKADKLVQGHLGISRYLALPPGEPPASWEGLVELTTRTNALVRTIESMLAHGAAPLNPSKACETLLAE